MEKFPSYVTSASKELKERSFDYSLLSTMGKVSNYSCLMPWQIENMNKILEKCLTTMAKTTQFIDGCAHIGADTINFVSFFLSKGYKLDVLAVEFDRDTSVVLQKNIDIFMNQSSMIDKSKIRIINSDINDAIMKYGNSSTVLFLDPPWDGPEYIKKDVIDLFLAKKPLHELINKIFIENLAHQVLIKVPINFNYDTFSKNLSEEKLEFEKYQVERPITKDNKKSAYFHILNIRRANDVDIDKALSVIDSILTTF